MINIDKHPAITTDRVAAYADAAAIALNIEIAPQYRPGVIVNLERLLLMGAQIMSFPLADDTELAPVFQP